MFSKRQQEAKGDGHNDIKDNLAYKITVARSNVNEGDKIHGCIGVVKDERKRCENWHEGKIENKSEVDIRKCTCKKNVSILRFPAGVKNGKIN